MGGENGGQCSMFVYIITIWHVRDMLPGNFIKPLRMFLGHYLDCGLTCVPFYLVVLPFFR